MTLFARNVPTNMPEREQPTIDMVVYVCPTPDCGNYYGSPRFRKDRSDIETMQQARSQSDGIYHDTHPRIECPDCRIRSGGALRVNRVPYVITEVVSLEAVIEALAKGEEKDAIY